MNLFNQVQKAVDKFDAPAKWYGEYDRLPPNSQAELRKLIINEIDAQTFE